MAKPDKPTTTPDLIVAPFDDRVSFTLPERFYDGDAGVDLFVPEHQIIPKGTKALVRTNLVARMRPGCLGLIVGRGSAFHSKGIHVVPGVIDPGYRGEIKVLVFAAGPKGIQLNRGDRVAQLVLLPYMPIEKVQRAKDKSLIAAEEEERGERAFGSTDQLVSAPGVGEDD